MSTPFRGPRLSSQPARSGEPSFWHAGKAGKGSSIGDSGLQAAQSAPVNRRYRTAASQGSSGAVNIVGYGPTLK
jgi:hypothetical protein